MAGLIPVLPSDIRHRSLHGPKYTKPIPLVPPFLLMVGDNDDMTSRVFIVVVRTTDVLLDWEVVVMYPRDAPHVGKDITLWGLFGSPYIAEDALSLCVRVDDEHVAIGFAACNPFVVGTVFRLVSDEAAKITDTVVKTFRKELKEKFFHAIRVKEMGPTPPLKWGHFKDINAFAELPERRAAMLKSMKASADRFAELPRSEIPIPPKYKEIKADIRAIRAALQRGSLKNMLDPKLPISPEQMKSLIFGLKIADCVKKVWFPTFRKVISTVDHGEGGDLRLFEVTDHRNARGTVWMNCAALVTIATDLMFKFKLPDDHPMVKRVQQYQDIVVELYNPKKRSTAFTVECLPPGVKINKEGRIYQDP